jgi:UDP-N-acetylmuramoylalanyl-D-glutamyl-2, 6-diaminopimelate ligase
MAQIAILKSDFVVFTSDNPRDENPEAILAEMTAGVKAAQADKYTTVVDRREGIREAYLRSQAGDILLLAGKGHETYQEIKGVRTHFDDMEEARTLMNEKN